MERFVFDHTAKAPWEYLSPIVSPLGYFFGHCFYQHTCTWILSLKYRIQYKLARYALFFSPTKKLLSCQCTNVALIFPSTYSTFLYIPGSKRLSQARQVHIFYSIAERGDFPPLFIITTVLCCTMAFFVRQVQYHPPSMILLTTSPL